VANAKGISLIDMVKFLRSRRREAAALLPEDLQHYLDEHISVARWYPEQDMIGLVKVLVRLMPEVLEEPLVTIGRLNARHHVKGAYNHFFRDLELSMLPIRATALWRSMHDTGEMTVRLGDNEAVVEIADYGYPSPEMCVMVQPYLEELFRAAGVEKPTTEKKRCRLRGDPVCSYDITWGAGGD